ncbi:MAG: hypothetical protein AAF449_17305 [Myxococcota bacterium]
MGGRLLYDGSVVDPLGEVGGPDEECRSSPTGGETDAGEALVADPTADRLLADAASFSEVARTEEEALARAIGRQNRFVRGVHGVHRRPH